MLASLAGAATLCTTGVDVLTLGACQFGTLTFSNWSVSVTGFSSATLFIGPLSTANSSVVNLDFQLTTGGVPAPAGGADILFTYTVSGGVAGTDLLLGTSSGNVMITENVCAVPLVFGACPTTPLATLSVSSGGNRSALQMFGSTVNTVNVAKDISFGAGATLSDFVNSAEIPEPFTYILMGSGLLALGLIRRKVRKS
jgi:hypothetical protein